VTDETLKSTPLSAAHIALGAGLTAFAGYGMPVRYPAGILKEHLWTRASAGVFDVSHMGPAVVGLRVPTGEPRADHRAVAALIEPLVCGDLRGLRPGQLRYTLLMGPDGGILDDLIIGRPAAPERQGELFLVANAGNKEADFALVARALGRDGQLARLDEGALIAVQGPRAAEVLDDLVPGVSALGFMTFADAAFEGLGLTVSRSGYTGEDGFEILAPAGVAERLWARLIGDARAAPAGLGARDSLRLEAGLPLHGHDIGEATSPVEAALGFAVSRRRLIARDFPGAARIAAEVEGGPRRLRVGLKVLEGAPAREGAAIATPSGEVVGAVTSGGFSPSLGVPIAMGYAPAALAEPGTPLRVLVRGKSQAAIVTALPFVPHRYVRKPSP
jgi:aminomethyltransferase